MIALVRALAINALAVLQARSQHMYLYRYLPVCTLVVDASVLFLLPITCHQLKKVLVQYQLQSIAIDGNSSQFIRAAAHMHAPVPMSPYRTQPCIYTREHPLIQPRRQVPLLSPRIAAYKYFVAHRPLWASSGTLAISLGALATAIVWGALGSTN